MPDSPPFYLRVALDTPVRRLFDYLPPAGLATTPAAGVRVEVPFGRGHRVGVLIGASPTSAVPHGKLKEVASILDDDPVFDAPTMELIEFAADYYQAPLGEVYAAALPVLLRQGRPLHGTELRWRRQGAPTGRVGPRQQAVLDLLAGRSSFGEAELGPLGPSGRAAARSLVARGLLEAYQAPAEPSPLATSQPIPGPDLNAGQAVAVAEIAGALGHFTPILLYGVTGSGKTEVYLRAIGQALDRGRQALVLVPEIGLTPQSIARFQSRLGAPLAVLHSGLTDSERLAMWRAARRGAARVVIGTRSAIFAPLAQLGLIVIDEEHDASYKQQEGFRYSARDLAVWRARRLGIPVVLGSATPMLETLANAAAGRYRRVNLPERAGSAGKPAVSLVDLRIHPLRQGLATPVMLAMQGHLDGGGQVLLYLNRRGFAPTLYCPGCAWVAPCTQCDARMTVHGRSQRLVCHHCGSSAPTPYSCPQCETELVPMGQGTERVEETLATVFPGIESVRIDRDTVRHRGDIDEALAKVRSGRARILVGTQMLTKGHDFPDVTLVVVLNADQGLFGTDFRTAERLAQTIVQVAGRAGRASRPGEVLIQTSCPQHPLLVQLLQGGYDGFAVAALAERAAARWPPYTHLALLRAEAADAASALAFLSRARAGAEPPVGGIRLRGPAPAAMERRAGRFRAQLLIEADDRGRLKRLLDSWIPGLEQLPEARRVRWSIDVDPIEVA